MDELIIMSNIQDNLKRIAVALEGILDRMTPAEERAKTYVVSGYVRSSNNGGNLVWLYGAHPGLKYKVATVYSEDFIAIIPYIPALGGRGKVYDGEVAPSREGAIEKGYMIEVPPFEVVVAPTGKRTEAGLMTYTFKAANSLSAAEPQPSPAAPEPEPEPKVPTAETKVPAPETKVPDASTKADKELDDIPGAQDEQKITEDQRKALFANAKGKFAGNEQYKAWLKTNFGTAFTHELTIRQASEAIKLLQSV